MSGNKPNERKRSEMARILVIIEKAKTRMVRMLLMCQAALLLEIREKKSST